MFLMHNRRDPRRPERAESGNALAGRRLFLADPRDMHLECEIRCLERNAERGCTTGCHLSSVRLLLLPLVTLQRADALRGRARPVGRSTRQRRTGGGGTERWLSGSGAQAARVAGCCSWWRRLMGLMRRLHLLLLDRKVKVDDESQLGEDEETKHASRVPVGWDGAAEWPTGDNTPRRMLLLRRSGFIPAEMKEDDDGPARPAR